MIEVFRDCALASTEGAIALARACQELFLKTGEPPRPALFDDELLEALRRRLAELSDQEREPVEWVLSFMK